MSEYFNDYRLDRSRLVVTTREQAERDQLEYWRRQTPQERLRGLEFLRYYAYGYDPISDRIPRVLTVVARNRR